MISSGFFLSLTLIFSLHLVSVYSIDLISGTWKTPQITSDTATACCVPTSMTISPAIASNYTAVYQFPRDQYPATKFTEEGYNPKCFSLFGSSVTTGSLTIMMNSNGTYNGYSAGTEPIVFEFFPQSSSSRNTLSVTYSSYSSDYNNCRFSMAVKQSTSSSSSSGFTYVVIIAVLIAVVALVAFRFYQKKQVNSLSEALKNDSSMTTPTSNLEMSDHSQV